MGCIYSNFNDECSLFDEDGIGRPNGCDKDGDCMVDYDPDPSIGCDMYESDRTCFDCGADFNQDEHCTCGEEE